jgi:predicted SAM-dependent methyltransferase
MIQRDINLRVVLWNLLKLAMRFTPTLDRSVAPPQADRLNIGCGQHGLSGWFNLDNSWSAWFSKRPHLHRLLRNLRLISAEHYALKWPNNIVVHDAGRGLPCADASIRFIYTSHFLEHLRREEARFVLRECYRVLVPGGLIRAVVPDLLFHVKVYCQAAETGLQHLSPEGGATLKHVETFLSELGIHPRRVADRMPHRWMYDELSLTYELAQAGFTQIHKCEFQRGEMLDVQLLDNRPKDSLHMEARKPKL